MVTHPPARHQSSTVLIPIVDRRGCGGLQALGGKQQFPYMIDPNTDKAMYESANIVDYLYATYGEGATKSDYLLPSTFLTGWMPSLLRFGRGLIRDEQGPAEAPKELLVLYSYDGNQFARLVREARAQHLARRDSHTSSLGLSEVHLSIET